MILVLGPDRDAVSGVSTHLNVLWGSTLATDFRLSHFQVGSEGRRESAASRFLRLVLSPLHLAAAILWRRAAVVHINTSLNARAYWRDIVYVMIAKLCGARVLYQAHGGAPLRTFVARSRALEAISRTTLRAPDVIVVLSQSELHAYREFVPGQQVVAVPNSIDCGPYAKLERRPPEPGAPLRMLYIGRLAREKGLYEALDGLRLAQAQGVRARLVVAGGGPEEAALRAFAERSGLDGSISFTGPVFGDEKIALFRDADVFLLPSYSEGLPYALLESMAAGVPVIITRVGAVPDVMNDGVHGLFVPPRDPQAIAGAIATLSADRALLARMAEVGRKRIATSYSIERLAQEFARLYSDLVGTRGMKPAPRA